MRRFCQKAATKTRSPFCRFLHAEPKPKIVMLTGPTAVGKSATALHLARLLDGEIITADSCQAYHDMQIGTNKPTQSELDIVPHWLVDFVPMSDTDFNVTTWHRLAKEQAEDILSRGKTPIVAGGTGFYLRWFLEHGSSTEGYQTATEEAQKNRQDRVNNFTRRDWSALIDSLSTTDEIRADLRATLVSNNVFRLARAVQKIESQKGDMTSSWNRGSLQSDALDYDFRCFFITSDRIQMYRQIDYRSEQFLEAGLIEEVVRLEEKGLTLDTRRGKTIGYRQVLAYLQKLKQLYQDGASAQDEVLYFLNMLADIQARTRNYSGRQIKWFRREPLFRWVNLNAAEQLPAELSLAHELVSLCNMSSEEYWADFESPEQQQQQRDLQQQDYDVASGLRTYRTMNRIYRKPADTQPHVRTLREHLFRPGEHPPLAF